MPKHGYMLQPREALQCIDTFTAYLHPTFSQYELFQTQRLQIPPAQARELDD